MIFPARLQGIDPFRAARTHPDKDILDILFSDDAAGLEVGEVSGHQDGGIG